MSLNMNSTIKLYDTKGMEWLARPADVLASGGEGTVYRTVKGKVIKLMHDLNAFESRGGARRINKLKELNFTEAVLPIDSLFLKDSTPAGLLMPFMEGEAIMSVFSSGWRSRTGFKDEKVIDLVEQMRKIIVKAHSMGIVLSDANENNWRIDKKGNIFILDTDSWGIAQFVPTAVSPAIDDPLRKGMPNKDSDWYSFAIIAFQMFVGMHPFKGKHPKYGKANIQERMSAGASLLDDGVNMPPSARSLKSIPNILMEWMKSVFTNKNRDQPPVCVSNGESVSVKKAGYRGNGKVKIKELKDFSRRPLVIFQLSGQAVFDSNLLSLMENNPIPLEGNIRAALLSGQGVPIDVKGRNCFIVIGDTHVRVLNEHEEELAELAFPGQRVMQTLSGPLIVGYDGMACFVKISEIGGKYSIAVDKIWNPPTDNPIAGSGAILYRTIGGPVASIVGKDEIRTGFIDGLEKDERIVSVSGGGGSLISMIRNSNGDSYVMLSSYSPAGRYVPILKEPTDDQDLSVAVINAKGIMVCSIDDETWLVVRSSDTKYSLVKDKNASHVSGLFAIDGMCCSFSGSVLSEYSMS